MAKLFEITEDIRQIARDGLDDLIEQLGKDCTLVYPPIMVEDDNVADDSIGQKGGNRWVTGGPVRRISPAQGGTGRVAQETTETIQMLVAWAPQDFYVKAPFNVQVPEGTIQTKGFRADLPKILRAQTMIISPDDQGLVRWRYEVDGEPIDRSNLTPSRYFVLTWRRVG